jgi:hypothetical protein
MRNWSIPALACDFSDFVPGLMRPVARGWLAASPPGWHLFSLHYV